jgi:regulator of protease activity HflC (stomatin/prohibitin superfamily)
MNVFFIIIGIFALIAGIVCAVVSTFNKNSSYSDMSKANISLFKRIGTIAIALGIILTIFGSSFTIIATGYTGVRTTFGQVSQKTLRNGWNWKAPFVQTIETVNNKQQDKTFASKKEDYIWGETSEKTPVYASDIIVSYTVNPEKSAWIVTNVSVDITDMVSYELVSSAVKNSTSKLTAENVTKREQIEALAIEDLQVSLNQKYPDCITVKKIVINDMEFEQSYNDAIAARSIAVQNQEKQRIENETAVAKAEADKKVKIAEAEGKAEALRIAAEAEAEANRKIRESLSNEIIKSKFYEKWDGTLPKVMGEGTVITDVADDE